MTVSVGTFDDLMGANEPQPIDRNPHIGCANCGEEFLWRDYWKPRVVEGDRVEEPNSDEPWRCDSCHRAHEKRRRRRENNRTLTEWSA